MTKSPGKFIKKILHGLYSGLFRKFFRAPAHRPMPGPTLARVLVNATLLLAFLCAGATPAKAVIIFQSDDFGTIPSRSLILNTNNDAGDIILQFGQALAETLRWSTSNTRFEFSNNLDLTNHQLSSARMENVTALPGGAGGLGAGGTGRIVELTSTDSIAPGCTGTACAAGTYSWNGTAWVSLSGAATASNSKIVTVGPTGRDYATIATAAAYLNTQSGGEMWLDPGSFPVTAAVNLADIKLRGADTALTTIAISGAGKLDVINSKFETLTINIDSGISAVMGLDTAYDASVSSALQFNQVNFIIGDAKIGIDSTSGTKPVTIATFDRCTQSGTGNLLNTVASSGLSASSAVTAINYLSVSPLKISNWPVTIVGGGNVVTTGAITTIPTRTVLVSPGMSIQAAVDSLGSSGGVVKLLVGTHDVTIPVYINNDNIVLTGEGPGTILRAQAGTWTDGTTVSDAVIQVGAANGTTPRASVIISNFKIQVGPNIPGIRFNGGTENKVMDMIVQSIGPKSTPGPRAGIVFTDGASAAGRKFTAARNTINSDAAANRWIDGIHVDGGIEATLSGQLFGYGNNIYDSVIYENIVSEARQTSYAFTNVYASGIFSNRARDLGWDTGAAGLFINNSQDLNVINNSLDGNRNTPTTGILLYSDVVNSVVVGNTIRGNSGTCSPPGSTDCLINIGINISGTVGGNSGNIVTDNQINNATTVIQDNGTASKLESNYHRATVNPSATDDISKGYGIGTIWINTTTASVYISVNSAVGAAVWSVMGGTTAHVQNTDTGTTSNTFTLDNDNTGGNVDLVFGATNNKILRWNSAAGEITTVNAGTNLGTYLKIAGGTAITGHLSATQANLVSASVPSRSCVNYGSITVTGAAAGDTAIATPTAVAGGIETVDLNWSALVTAANTVTIRACNPTTSAIDTGNTQTWRADVWKH